MYRLEEASGRTLVIIGALANEGISLLRKNFQSSLSYV